MIIIIFKNAFKPLAVERSNAQTALRRTVPPCAPLVLPGSQSLRGTQLDQEEKYLLPICNKLYTLSCKLGNGKAGEEITSQIHIAWTHA